MFRNEPIRASFRQRLFAPRTKRATPIAPRAFKLGGGLALAGAFVGVLLAPHVLAAPAPAAGETHWAFEPIRSVRPPDTPTHSRSWPQTPIDQFILARLEKSGLRPGRPASREVLLRRVYFDLIGLPPTPAELDAFAADRSPEAWAKVVDRLLASPHYGERWARHWLDVVRYAETDGFEHDAVRPNTWRYRDYVIASFNADKPYDRFVQEQIAGDELWPEDPASVVATAFHLLGPDMVDSADQVQRRLLTLSDMTDTTATAFLGLTMGCARCHDHKLEPFTQTDYYSLQAYFAPAQFLRDRPVPTAAERAHHERAMAIYNARTGDVQKQLLELERPYREKLREEKLGQMSEDVQLAHRTPRDRRTPEQESSVLETAPQLQIVESELRLAMTASDQGRRAELQKELKKVPKPEPLPLTLALQNTNGPAPATHVLLRGDYNNPAAAVAPVIPAIFRGKNSREASAVSPRDRSAESRDEMALFGSDARRRTALAQWLTDPKNPLTARVMVNRIWQHHFGHGLVDTPNDFGTRGARPTHPELLDWLAGRLVADGWSIKAMHRLILLSATYQQTSEAPPDALRADPENRLLARQNRVRLEGEALRDSLLLVSEQLNTRVGGPSVLPPIPQDIVRTSKNWTASPDGTEHDRRSIYIFARRNLRFPFLEVFDAPDSNLSCPERGQSTTAPQSLTLLNSREVMRAARATAQLLMKDAADDDARIRSAFRRILGHFPSRSDRSAARDFLKTIRAAARPSSGGEAPAPTPTPANQPSAESTKLMTEPGPEWRELCRALFNLNEFVYVE
jgi:hypothetical protein